MTHCAPNESLENTIAQALGYKWGTKDYKDLVVVALGSIDFKTFKHIIVIYMLDTALN